MDVAGKRFIVVGLGASGEAAASFLCRKGAQVWVTEGGSDPTIEDRATRLRDLGVAVETGGHSFHDVDADVAVISPGIPPASRIITHLQDAGVRVIGEIELAARFIQAPIIAVTGTNGKTTTTSLIAKILEESGRPSMSAGNIGRPLIEASHLDAETAVIAAEVSSFQLWSIDTFRPRVAVLLNIAEDHMDWHGSLEVYAQAKARIFENQGPDDVLVYNAEDGLVASLAGGAPSRAVPFSGIRPVSDGVGVEGGSVVWRGAPIFSIHDIPMAGAAGVEDAVAAAAAVLEFGIEPDAVARGLKSFEPLPHRLQIVARHEGVTYINDSKATNPHATLAAVRGLEDVVLIAGGRSKGIDLGPLVATVPPVRAVVALGEAQDELERVFAHAVPVERATDMRDAVRRAYARSSSRGSVLLAPACASLDMYENYAARGRAFTQAVEELITGSGERSDDGHA
jgi:UDP-N-acetylmuramoylalanine--D-glutamate ligase